MSPLIALLQLNPTVGDIEPNAAKLLSAAAKAEAGDFAAAERFAQQAIELAVAQGKNNLADKIKARLQIYKLGKRYRDLPLSQPLE